MSVYFNLNDDLLIVQLCNYHQVEPYKTKKNQDYLATTIVKLKVLFCDVRLGSKR